MDDPKLTGLKAMLKICEQIKDNITIQIGAFPQESMHVYKGGGEMVEEAQKMGVGCVGSIPHFEWSREIGEKSVHRTVERTVKYALRGRAPARPACWHRYATANTCSKAPSQATRSRSICLGKRSEKGIVCRPRSSPTTRMSARDKG